MGKPTTKWKTCRRWNHAGDAHELTFCTFRRLPLLTHDRPRDWFLNALDAARSKLNFGVVAYVIMPEHVHLIVIPRTPEYDIAAILRAIKWPVAQHARRHLENSQSPWLAHLTDIQPSGERHVRFWQRGGGFDRNVRDWTALTNMVAYIHLNPVRRGLCTRPEDWQWSSAAWFEGRRDGAFRIDEELLL